MQTNVHYGIRSVSLEGTYPLEFKSVNNYLVIHLCSYVLLALVRDL